MPSGVADQLNVNLSPGHVESIQRSLSDFAVPASAFRHALPPVSLDAGAAGNLTATLVSSFQWKKGDDYRVAISFSGRVNRTLTWYWDERFGSVYPHFSS